MDDKPVSADNLGMPDISIVIPVYNALPYLNKALDCLVAQTFEHKRMEILLIDDGSTDGSGEICDTYSNKYPMFRVVHQENSGIPSVPRNKGIELARGEYLFFHDADDYLGNEAVERMLRHAREWNSDILIVKFGKTDRYKITRTFERESKAQVDFYASTISRTTSPVKLFKRDFIIGCGLVFKHCFSEDTPFFYEACLRTKAISVAADYDYYWAINRADGKQLTKLTSINEELIPYRRRTAVIEFINTVQKLVTDYVDFDAAESAVFDSLYVRYNWALKNLLLDQSEGIDEAIAVLRTAVQQIWNPKFIRLLSVHDTLLMQALIEEQSASMLYRLLTAMRNPDKAPFEFFYQDGHRYYRYNESGAGVFVDTITFNLFNVGSFHDHEINKAFWKENCLVIEGDYFSPNYNGQSLVIFCKLNDKVVLLEVNCEVRGQIPSISKMWKGLKQVTLSFTCSIDCAALAAKSSDYMMSAEYAPKQSFLCHWYLYVGFRESSVIKRIGSKREPNVFWGFIEGGGAIRSRNVELLKSEIKPNAKDTLLFIPYETEYKNFCIAQFLESTSVARQSFVKSKRAHPNNRIVLATLREEKNDVAARIIEGITKGNPPKVEFHSNGVRYVFNDEFSVELAQKDENLPFAIKGIAYENERENPYALIFEGNLEWSIKKEPPSAVIVAKPLEGNGALVADVNSVVVPVSIERQNEMATWRARLDTKELFEAFSRNKKDDPFSYFELGFTYCVEGIYISRPITTELQQLENQDLSILFDFVRSEEAPDKLVVKMAKRSEFKLLEKRLKGTIKKMAPKLYDSLKIRAGEKSSKSDSTPMMVASSRKANSEALIWAKKNPGLRSFVFEVPKSKSDIASPECYSAFFKAIFKGGSPFKTELAAYRFAADVMRGRLERDFTITRTHAIASMEDEGETLIKAYADIINKGMPEVADCFLPLNRRIKLEAIRRGDLSLLQEVQSLIDSEARLGIPIEYSCKLIEKENLCFSEVDDFYEYVSYMKLISKGLLICLSANDSIRPKTGNGMVQYMQVLGCKANLLRSRQAYICIIDEGKVKERQSLAGEILLFDAVVDGHSLHIESRAFEEGSFSQIRIDGIDYSVNKRGLNIVVYDKNLAQVVDSVCFDTWVNASKPARRQ